LQVVRDHTTIKIEPNLIFRGSVFPTVKLPLCKGIQEQFLVGTEVCCLSQSDIYAGKLCAALDRQHPRDLFDVKLLCENVGITEAIRQAFVVYVASSDRPIHELLNPTRLNVRAAFNTQFVGMTQHSVSYEELEIVREKLIQTLQQELTQQERQ